MINNNKEKLIKRIYSRGKISTFDLQAYGYNTLYLYTYNYMRKHDMLINKLFLVDVTNLSLYAQINKVKDVILYQV